MAAGAGDAVTASQPRASGWTYKFLATRPGAALTIGILLLSLVFKLSMEVSSAVATWASLAVTVVGLGSIGIQV
ncbi:hypothetical protein BJX62DRAFT_218268 [Aspergillus germanicus]